MAKERQVNFENPCLAALKNRKEYGYQAEHAVKNSGIAGSILATFAIAPWAFVGFDTIPQAAEEFKFSYKKIIFIMLMRYCIAWKKFCQNLIS